MKDETSVMINMLAIAHYEQMPDFPIQLMTTGKLQTLRDGEMILRYQETQPEDTDGPEMTSEVTLHLTPKRVTMERTGDFHNMMVFSPGKRFEGMYSTPYGEMPIAVFSREAKTRYTGERGSVHLKYDLEIQGNLASSNELHLEFFPEEKARKAGNANETTDQ